MNKNSHLRYVFNSGIQFNISKQVQDFKESYLALQPYLDQVLHERLTGGKLIHVIKNTTMYVYDIT